MPKFYQIYIIPLESRKNSQFSKKQKKCFNPGQKKKANRKKKSTKICTENGIWKRINECEKMPKSKNFEKFGGVGKVVLRCGKKRRHPFPPPAPIPPALDVHCGKIPPKGYVASTPKVVRCWRLPQLARLNRGFNEMG